MLGKHDVQIAGIVVIMAAFSSILSPGSLFASKLA